MEEKTKGVQGTVEKMRAMAADGYDARQISLKLITPKMGKKKGTTQKKLSPAEKAKKKLQSAFLRKKAAKAKSKAKAKAKAKGEASAKAIDVEEDKDVLGPWGHCDALGAETV